MFFTRFNFTQFFFFISAGIFYLWGWGVRMGGSCCPTIISRLNFLGSWIKHVTCVIHKIRLFLFKRTQKIWKDREKEMFINFKRKTKEKLLNNENEQWSWKTNYIQCVFAVELLTEFSLESVFFIFVWFYLGIWWISMNLRERNNDWHIYIQMNILLNLLR